MANAVAAIALAAALCGCGSIANRSTNAPARADAPLATLSAADVGGEYTIGLSFSGGGMRAAAFSYGVLDTLRTLAAGDGDALGEVGFITSVSGGSLTAGYFGAFGREGLARYREEVLLRDFERDLPLPFDPLGVLRMLWGGSSSGGDFRERLDREVFHGATFASILDRRRPEVRINATDLYNRIAFPFIPRAFDIICSDLRDYRVAHAVAASMAVPLVFPPVVLKTYPDACHEPLLDRVADLGSEPHASRLLRAAGAALRGYRDPARSHYIRLADGGLSDNHGLTTLLVSRAVTGTLHEPMTARDAVRVRRALFIVVNGSDAPGGTWDLDENDPSAVELALHASAAAIDASARQSADAFASALADWEASIARWRCGLTRDQAAALGAGSDWQCGDVRIAFAFLSIDELEEPWRSRLAALPTRLEMRAEDVDVTVEAARVGLLRLPQLREYLSGRGTHREERR